MTINGFHDSVRRWPVVVGTFHHPEPTVTPDTQVRQSSRLEPETAWTVLTEAPLKGIGLAREAGSLLVWDDADQLYLLDLYGEYRSVARAPGKILAAAISDDGSRAALLLDGPRLCLLDADLGVVSERAAPPESIGLGIDPHGRFVIVSSRMSVNHIYNRHGKPAGRFNTHQPLAFLQFLADKPTLISAASYGMIAAFDLEDAGGGKLNVEPFWQDRQIANVGRLACTGDGAMILASCFTHGVQRYDLHGHNAGAYHLGGTCTHAVPDFAGRIMAVATLEGELSVLNSGGNVRWKNGLPRAVAALEVDPLGRFLIYGHATGEVVRLDLYADERPSKRSKTPSAPVSKSSTASGPRANIGVVRPPSWTLPVVQNDDHAETAVLSLLDDPGRVVVFPSSLRLQILTTEGRNLGYAPEIVGVGRIIRTAPGWIAGATDRQIVLFNAVKETTQRVEVSLVEVTHLAILPESYGLAIVQERDRIGRATISGRWIWKLEMKAAVEEIAINPLGYTAVTTDGGVLTVYDAAGVSLGAYQADPAEPLCLIDSLENAPTGVAWLTLARRSQVVRGHDVRGNVLWESPVAWEGWQFHWIGPLAVVVAPDGRVQAFDGAGHLRGQGKSSETAGDVFGVNRKGEPRRISHQGVHLICSDLDGRVRWRTVCDEPLGSVAVGRDGVAAMIGRSLAWFPGLD